MSWEGSPWTMRRSASLPGWRAPRRSWAQQDFAASPVAETMASRGESPASVWACISCWKRPMGRYDHAASEPAARRTPALTMRATWSKRISWSLMPSSRSACSSGVRPSVWAFSSKRQSRLRPWVHGGVDEDALLGDALGDFGAVQERAVRLLEVGVDDGVDAGVEGVDHALG